MLSSVLIISFMLSTFGGLRNVGLSQGSINLLWKTLILQKIQPLIFLISDSSSKTSQACTFSFKHKLEWLPTAII